MFYYNWEIYTLQSYQDGVCKIGENKILHPLAYILHTHALGQVGTVQGAVDWVENLSPAMGRGINSRNRVWHLLAKLRRLAGRYDNPMLT